MSWFEGSQPFQVTKPIRLIELFAGVGSQAKALERLGVNFEHYKVCEFDKYPMASYNAIHDTSFNVSDIQKITAEDLNICDTNKYTYILTYSFPCQDLSYAGKQSGMAKGDNTRSGLLWEVERILKECKELPQILLMENVPAVCGQKNIKDFQQWISFLESIGYKSKYQILNAKNYEVPQNRDRCFMVSWLGDFYYEFPEPIPLSRRLKDVLEENVDEKYYLSDRVVERLIRSQNVHVERERERESSNTIRCGGRGSLDPKHRWDIIFEYSQNNVRGKSITDELISRPNGDSLNERNLPNAESDGLQGPSKDSSQKKDCGNERA